MANRPTPRTPRRATLAGMPPSPPERAPKTASEPTQDGAQAPEAPAPEAPPKRKPGRPRKATTEGNQR